MNPLNKNTDTAANNNKKTINISLIILYTIELFLVFVIIFSYYFTQTVDSKRVIFIPKGSTASIITYLNKKSVGLNSIDKALINYYGYPQSGWIDLKATHMKKYDYLYKLTRSKAAVRNITLIPGETYYYFLKDIAKRMNLKEEDLFDSYNKRKYKKDGNILSQTYSLPIGMKADELISYLIQYTHNEYEKYSKKIFGTYDKKQWYKYITIASIIQKESASKEEMATVSSVVYNRLNKKMRLQMDGTLNYGKFSHTKITPAMIRNDKTSYNTYKTKNIPEDPVCAIEFEAIKAAIFPRRTNYLYFMKAIGSKEHMFSKSLKGHQKAIDKVKQYNRTNQAINNIKARAKIKKDEKIKKDKVYIKLQNESKKRTLNALKDLWKTVK